MTFSLLVALHQLSTAPLPSWENCEREKEECSGRLVAHLVESAPHIQRSVLSSDMSLGFDSTPGHLQRVIPLLSLLHFLSISSAVCQ